MSTVGDLIGAIKARQAEISSSLAAGTAASWEAYHRIVGVHQGLQEALLIIDKLLKDPDENE
jgi:hypothetical protein